jgi:hypothetical protein
MDNKWILLSQEEKENYIDKVFSEKQITKNEKELCLQLLSNLEIELVEFLNFADRVINESSPQLKASAKWDLKYSFEYYWETHHNLLDKTLKTTLK